MYVDPRAVNQKIRGFKEFLFSTWKFSQPFAKPEPDHINMLYLINMIIFHIFTCVLPVVHTIVNLSIEFIKIMDREHLCIRGSSESPNIKQLFFAVNKSNLQN